MRKKELILRAQQRETSGPHRSKCARTSSKTFRRCSDTAMRVPDWLMFIYRLHGNLCTYTSWLNHFSAMQRQLGVKLKRREYIQMQITQHGGRSYLEYNDAVNAAGETFALLLSNNMRQLCCGRSLFLMKFSQPTLHHWNCSILRRFNRNHCLNHITLKIQIMFAEFANKSSISGEPGGWAA